MRIFILKYVCLKNLFETEKKNLLNQIETLNQEIDEKNLELQTEKSFHDEKQRESESKLKDLESRINFFEEENKKISRENVCNFSVTLYLLINRLKLYRLNL